MAKYDSLGREVPDGRPVQVPHNWQRPLSLQEEIKRFVRVQLSQQAADLEAETFEEADDFDVADEEPDPLSPYEIPEAPVEALGGVRDEDADPPPPPDKKTPVEAPSEPEGDTK